VLLKCSESVLGKKAGNIGSDSKDIELPGEAALFLTSVIAFSNSDGYLDSERPTLLNLL
jgi:hypothetical protein